jgi:hypothetical protein
MIIVIIIIGQEKINQLNLLNEWLVFSSANDKKNSFRLGFSLVPLEQIEQVSILYLVVLSFNLLDRLQKGTLLPLPVTLTG